MDFSAAHKSRLTRTFFKVDRLLAQAVRSVDPVELRSPLSSLSADATALQHDVASRCAADIRKTMAATLERLGAFPPETRNSAIGACRVAVDHALMEIADLRPESMRGDGPLSEALEAELNRIVSQLLDSLETLDRYLAERSEPGSSSEMPQLGDSTAARSLREVHDLVGANSLSQFAGPMRQLVERFRSSDLEVAVFGRTNAGKSSLLNRLLEGHVLPTGAIEVTRVPVRVSFGPRAVGYVSFVGRPVEQFTVDRLQEFAAAHFNPANRLQVTGIRVELPARILASGVALVDMPGFEEAADGAVGISDLDISCDIGILVVDSCATVTFQERIVLDSLRRSGSEVIVLVSKADRLSAEERWSVHGSIERALLDRVHVQVPIFLASTTTRDPLLDRDWIDRGLNPLLVPGGELRRLSLTTKLERLRAAVKAAAEQHANVFDRAGTPVRTRTEALAALDEARDWLHCASGDLPDPVGDANRQSSRLIAEVAHNVAALWPLNHEPSFDATPLLDAALKARALAGNAAARRSLCALRARCAIALQGTAGTPGTSIAVDELPALGDGPAFDPQVAASPTLLPRPPLHFLGTAWRRRITFRQLADTSIRPQATKALAAHFQRVRTWHARIRESMVRIVEARIGTLRGQSGTPPGSTRAAESRLRLADRSPRPGATAQ